MHTPRPHPPSAVSNGINALGVAAFLATLYICHEHAWSALSVTLLTAASYAVVIISLEVIVLKTPFRASTGLDFSRRPPLSLARIFTKLLGIYGALSFIALLYWLFPEYHGSFYDIYWDGVCTLLPWIVGLAVPYVAFVDARMREPHDGCYWFGRCLLLKWRGVERRVISQYLLGWLVKGFFLPLMFVSITNNLHQLMTTDIHSAVRTFLDFFRNCLLLCYTLDLLVTIAGYTLTLRLLDTHIRSTESTLYGWWICVICYEPFQSIYMNFYLAYRNDEDNWIGWLSPHPVLQMAWGSVALLLIVLYMIASVNFGCRFSNLTNRGIITNGLYRFTKHPAYIAKNLHWWMAFVPFVPLQGLESLRYCLLLLGINLVYYLRARTEERHLSHDPDYVAYALWMNENGMFRWLVRYCPFLRYKAPARQW